MCIVQRTTYVCCFAHMEMQEALDPNGVPQVRRLRFSDLKEIF